LLRSKLEMYVDILEVLVRHGPLKLAHIMCKANVNCSVLKEYLEFLIQQNLIEEETVGNKRIVYAITRRGITALKYFREFKTGLPMVDEAQGKHFHATWCSNVKSHKRKFIGNFIRILNAVGGVMDRRTYLDLINETKTEMNLSQVEDAKLLSIRTDMEKMGHLRKATDTETELWVLTLKGLKFAETIK